MIDFKYRPDVDGLRAVAVVLVVLFHAGLGFSGGYIGVDVFFVISGFLITGLILKEQDAGTFGLANFWVRRIRRIVPAATAMVIAVLVAGYFLLLPYDFADLGESTVAQQLMVSNFYFWKNTGYFDGSAEIKPLLHTWSLAIEEQFYLGYPFLLMLLHRFGRRATVVVLVLLGAGSLAISQFGVQYAPSATFFLLPSRAWELLIGGLIWFLPRPERIAVRVQAVLSWLSLAAILAAGWMYTAATPFPGLAALVPCAATAVLIYCNSTRLSLPAAILASRPFVFVGLISYSLYLWHWPLFAFGRYWLGEDLPPLVSVSAIAASFVLGVASWKFVETPMRKRPRAIRPTRAVLGATASACLIVATALLVDVRDGFAERLPEHIRMVALPLETAKDIAVNVDEVQRGQLPALGVASQQAGTPDFIVWGDSHAMALAACFDAAGRDQGLCGVIAARSATVPLLGVWRPAYKKDPAEAPRWNQSVLDYIRQREIKNVFLIARWAVNIEGQLEGTSEALIAGEDDLAADPESAATAFEEGLNRTLDELQSLGARVWILKQVPLQQFSPQRAIVRSLYLQTEIPRGVTLQQHRARQHRANGIIEGVLPGRAAVRAVDLSTAFFDADGRSTLGDLHGSFYRDENHVSELGARQLIRPTLDDVLAGIRRTRPQGSRHKSDITEPELASDPTRRVN